jgi:GH15 family glucan-1,4-alpha-glucosidase
MQFSRDTYSYVWPRDGALGDRRLDLAGFQDVARSFYTFCQKAITADGYFYHKYNPDGSPASSWHPWVIKGEAALPIQEDETALVVWRCGGITTATATSSSSARCGWTSFRRRPTSCAAIAIRAPGCRCPS